MGPSRLLPVSTLFCLLAGMIFARGAIAQAPAAVLVVAESPSDPAIPPALMTTLATANPGGQPVVVGRAASELVTANGSYPATEFVDAGLRQAASIAVAMMVRGELTEARAELEGLLADAQGRIDSLGQGDENAAQVLDACLFLARSYEDEGDLETTRAVSLRCRRLVPDLAPNPLYHSSTLIEMFEQADADLPATGVPLLVTAGDHACTIRLNGREMGATPFEAPLLQGAYTVQAFCGEAGESRVHRITLGSEATTLELDIRFDQRLQTALQGVRLTYSGQVPNGRRWLDAARAGRLAGAHRVLLLAYDEDRGGWTLTLVNADSGTVESVVYLPLAPSIAHTRAAVEALRTLASVDIETGEPIELAGLQPASADIEPDLDPQPEPEFDYAYTFDGARFGLGLSLTLVGAGALAFTAYLIEGAAAEEAIWANVTGLDQIGPQQDIEARRRLIFGFGISGGVVLTVGLPLLFPAGQPPGVLSWTLGGLGLVASGLSTMFFLKESECIRMCDAGGVDGPETAPYILGMGLLEIGIPLLALPLIQLATAGAPDTQWQVSVRDSQLMFSGRW